MYKLIRMAAGLPLPKTFIIVFTLLSLVLPGVLFIACFLPGLLGFDALKLVLTAAAFIFPFYLSLWVSFLLFLPEGNITTTLTEKHILGSLFLAGVIVHAEVVVALVIGCSLDYFSTFEAGFYAGVFHLLLFILAVRAYRRKGRPVAS